MGIDAWGVKLKNNKNWKTAFWEDIDNNFKVNKILSKENYFYENMYNSKINRFIQREVLKNKNISFTGDPCCSREALSKTVSELKKWIEVNPNKDYKDTETFENYTDIITAKEISDLLEYLTILDYNNCVMWFSI